jgi:serine/threonine-protein kinase
MKKVAITVLLVGALLLLVGCDKAVPDVKGKTVEQARSALESAGFRLGTVDYDENGEGAPGAVIAQDPAAGKTAKADTPVVVTVAGSPPVTTPQIVGLGKARAKVTLEAAGLTLGDLTRAYDAKIAAGAVVSQDPGAGKETPKGSAVAVVLSKGPPPVAVPNVKGKTQAAATSLLEKKGFNVEVVTAESPAAKGTVVSQKPASGKLQPGSTVVITVSSGVALVKVPKVVGMDAPDAEAALKAVGLKPVNVVHNGPAGTINGQPADIMQVYKQSPGAGSMVAKGTVVKIYWWSEAN